MTALWSIMASRATGPAVLGAAMLLLATCLGQCTAKLKAERALGRVETQLQVAQANLHQCQAGRAALEASVAVQNAAVEGFKADAARRATQGKRAVETAQRVADSYRRQADRILATAAVSADSCSEAERLIGEVVR